MKNENMKKKLKINLYFSKKKAEFNTSKSLLMQDWVFQIGVHWLFNEIMKIVQP